MNTATLSLHLLRLLADLQMEGERHDLESLSQHLSVRRNDVRTALRELHRGDLYDVLRNRLTLEGFAAARQLSQRTLPPLRAENTQIAAA